MEDTNGDGAGGGGGTGGYVRQQRGQQGESGSKVESRRCIETEPVFPGWELAVHG